MATNEKTTGCSRVSRETFRKRAAIPCSTAIRLARGTEFYVGRGITVYCHDDDEDDDIVSLDVSHPKQCVVSAGVTQREHLERQVAWEQWLIAIGEMVTRRNGR